MPPNVSVIVPCLNERATISLLLDALFNQTYPRSAMEIVISDGGSTDGTQDAIAVWHDQHQELGVKVVDNPAQTIPTALNTAIKASTGEIIVRLDAHSEPSGDYVERSVNALISGQAQNVGGVWDISPRADHWIARSIAEAASHPIGVGDAWYRYSNEPAEVDTVPFGAFKRELLDQVGMFDETLLANEDYEFNTRIRQAGGKVWLDPAIRSVYYARATLKALAKQYWRYGFWKVQMLRRYPDTIRWRQALPPAFVAGLIFLILLAPFFRLMFWLLIGVIGLYGLFLLIAGLQVGIKKKKIFYLLGVPLAIACMHFSWGSGFIWGILNPQNRNTG